jgi:outer membrane protein assembly factor BamB
VLSPASRARRLGCALGPAAALIAVLVTACTAPAPAPDTAPVAAAPSLAGPLPPVRIAEQPLVVPTVAAGTASWAPWPAALHDSRHSGASPAVGPSAGVVRWRRRLEGAVTAGPVVGADGTVYSSSNGGVLHALDPATGADRWVFDSGHPGGGDLSVSPLVLPDRTILFPTPGRELVALAPGGRVLWSEQLPGTPTSPASADGHRIYVGDQSGNVTALEVTTGGHRRAWTLSVGSSSYGSVVTDGTGRLYTTTGSSLVAIDDRADRGVPAWSRDPGDDITEVSAGLAADHTALLGTNGGHEWAYHPDGTPAWNAPRVITYSSPATPAGGLAYVADHSGRVQAWDTRTGHRAASFGPVGAQIWSSTILDRDYRLYLGTQDGHALGLAPDGTRLFDIPLGGAIDSYPALTGDGTLLMGSRDGTLTAIG